MLPETETWYVSENIIGNRNIVGIGNIAGNENIEGNNALGPSMHSMLSLINAVQY